MKNRRHEVPENDRELYDQLSTSDQAFYFSEGLTSSQRSKFLHMNRDDRTTIQGSSLEPRVKSLMWSYASTRALKTINNGMVNEERSKSIWRVGKVMVCVALFAMVPLDFFINTYVKLHELNNPDIQAVVANTTEKQ